MRSVGRVVCLAALLTAAAVVPGSAPKTVRAQDSGPGAPQFTQAMNFAVSAPLTELPGGEPAPAPGESDFERENRALPKSLAPTADGDPDAAIQPLGPGDLIPAPAPILSVDGLSNADNAANFGFRLSPPDTDGEVGPNHYVQYVNLLFRVYDKSSGAPLTAPLKLSTLYAPLGGLCAGPDRGDPIVLYDQLADRWVLSQFAFVGSGTVPPYHECIAVSKTADPAGAYYLYDFLVPTIEFNDYPKLGVWPDGYYMTANQFFRGTSFDGTGAFAMNRKKMLAGDPTANLIYFNLNLASHPEGIGGALPSDLDGLNPPPAGAPNVFAYFIANEFNDPIDGLRFFDFHADFDTPANSTFTERQAPLPVPAFDPRSPNGGTSGRADIEQPPPANTNSAVQAIQDRLMFRLAYRNFGDHESLVVNHTVNVTGVPNTPVTQANHQAGVRYYELRRTTPTGPFAVEFASTIAPDTDNRWMGSAAQDNQGNIAVGFSVSSTTRFPSIRYAGRLADGTIATEQVLAAGSGVQTSTGSRWGDYSAMSVDPVDDCTFWYTQEYYTAASQATSSVGWLTHINSFKYSSCMPSPRGSLTGLVSNSTSGLPIAGALVDLGNGHVTSTDSTGHYTMFLLPDSYLGRASALNFSPSPSTPIAVANGTATVQNFVLTPTGADLFVTESGPTTGQGGAPVLYTFTIGNNGPLAATSVVFDELTPSGAIFASAVPSQGSCGTTPPQGGTGPISCSVGTLAVGATATVKITFHSTDGAGQIHSVGSVSSAVPDALTFNNTAALTTLLTCGGDLTFAAGPIGTAANSGLQTGRLFRSGAPSVCGFPKPFPGFGASTGSRKFDAFQFTSEGTSSSCVRVDVTPGATCPGGNIYAAAYLGPFDAAHLDANFLADVGSSPGPGNTATFSFDVPAGATFTLVFSEVTSQPTTTSCAAYTYKVRGLPKACALSNLSLTKSGSPSTVTAGAALTYTINGANGGTADASSSVFSDFTPPNTTFQSMASPAGWACMTPPPGGTGEINCTRPTFAAGGAVTFSPVFAVNCPLPDGTVISNKANLTSSTNDPNPFNNQGSATNSVSNPGPAISGVSVSASMLWPPNHQMVDVGVDYLAPALCGPSTTSLTVASSEQDDGTGDGDTAQDIEVVDNHHVRLRAERSGSGPGRIYTITIRAVDGAGNASTSSVQVVVPHDHS